MIAITTSSSIRVNARLTPEPLDALPRGKDADQAGEEGDGFMIGVTSGPQQLFDWLAIGEFGNEPAHPNTTPDVALSPRFSTSR